MKNKQAVARMKRVVKGVHWYDFYGWHVHTVKKDWVRIFLNEL